MAHPTVELIVADFYRFILQLILLSSGGGRVYGAVPTVAGAVRTTAAQAEPAADRSRAAVHAGRRRREVEVLNGRMLSCYPIRWCSCCFLLSGSLVAVKHRRTLFTRTASSSICYSLIGGFQLNNFQVCSDLLMPALAFCIGNVFSCFLLYSEAVYCVVFKRSEFKYLLYHE